MNNSFHIGKVHLSGYRTLKDVNIDFVPGLNIIIGKNGVGKSNFFQMLNSVVNLEVDIYNTMICDFEWHENGKFESWKLTRKVVAETDKRFVIAKYAIMDSDGISFEFGTDEALEFHIRNRKAKWFFSDYLPHDIHLQELFFLNKPFETKSVDRLDEEVKSPTKLEYYSKLPYYLKSLLVRMTFQLRPNMSRQELRDKVENLISNFTYFSQTLTGISVIQEFRFRNDFEIKVVDKRIEIQNLQFEFLVGNEWFSYNDLSDGTKRIFNIILDVSFDEQYMSAKGFWGFGDDIRRVVLIEEPELGIHPHELKKLMTFLKDESRHKQIIVSTHSPDVLDVLGKDDLDRIILADYDSNEGTTLRHLSDEEQKKASTFMENEAFLSDYWKYSTLEAR